MFQKLPLCPWCRGTPQRGSTFPAWEGCSLFQPGDCRGTQPRVLRVSRNKEQGPLRPGLAVPLGKGTCQLLPSASSPGRLALGVPSRPAVALGQSQGYVRLPVGSFPVAQGNNRGGRNGWGKVAGRTLAFTCDGKGSLSADRRSCSSGRSPVTHVQPGCPPHQAGALGGHRAAGWGHLASHLSWSGGAPKDLDGLSSLPGASASRGAAGCWWSSWEVPATHLAVLSQIYQSQTD